MEQQTAASESEQTPLIVGNVVFYEEITGTSQYRWIDYLNIRVIEDTETGYINASKMCLMYGKTKNGEPKRFRTRIHQSLTPRLIEYVKQSGGILAPKLLFSIENGLDAIKGTYVHRD